MLSRAIRRLTEMLEHASPGLSCFHIGKKDKEVKEVEPEADAEESGPSYEELALRVSAISKPLASKKLTKKIYKVSSVMTLKPA